MKNPFLKKNPFMSVWLSGANTVFNAVRGQATAQVKRQSRAAVNQATQETLALWTGAAPKKRAGGRRRKQP